MLFESLHKTFNKQVDSISRGNVIGDAQYSMYIRPFNETECNGMTFKNGELRAFDLKGFITLGVPNYIIEQVKNLTEDTKTILYLFKHYNKGVRVNDGLVLTTATDKPKVVHIWYLNNRYKANSAVDEAINYITA